MRFRIQRTLEEAAVERFPEIPTAGQFASRSAAGCRICAEFDFRDRQARRGSRTANICGAAATR